VIVPHGLRSSHQREQQRRELVTQAVATPDLERFAAILASIDQVDRFGFHAELVLRVGVPIVAERVVHGQGQGSRPGGEDQRRRRPALPPD
jgi:hypothetical protein